MAFGGNTRDLDSFGEEMDKITDLHQIHEEVLLTERGDGVVGIKQRRRDPSSDSVWNLETASRRGRLKEDLESFALRRRQDHKAKPSSGLDLTYAPSTITSQKPTERELDLLFETIYDDYIGGQQSAALRTAPATPTLQVLLTLTNSSPQATYIPNTSQEVDELEPEQ
nr:hypothetical protein [Tanacetum cinerariifolium]